MKKITIKNIVRALLELQDEGKSATLLGIGPMSLNLLQASFELGRDYDFPLMFIASRNQVDKDELGGGYVNGWNQFTFVNDIKAIAEKTNFNGLYYICRDHGGPWQRDKERNDHLPVDEAMRLSKESYLADIEAGFDLIMIDPTKDPFEIGKVIPLETVIERTVELIEYCEKERRARNLPEVGYEIGTEETNGGLTSTEIYEKFIIRIKDELTAKNLPMPTFIVGQTGTLTRKVEQAGKFNFKNAYSLAKMAKKYNVGLKEHNSDYLDDVALLEHIPSNVTAANVAPQFGTEETRGYIKLCKVEKKLKDNNIIPDCSNLYNILLEDAIRCEKWRKWMVGDNKSLTVDEIMGNNELSKEILEIAGHYTFNNEVVKKETEILYRNLAKANIDGQRFIVDHIKRSIRNYVECFNLKGSTTRIMEKLNSN